MLIINVKCYNDNGDYMKLEKWLSNSGIASRRKSKQLILDGLVKVNDKVVLEPSFLVSSKDRITYNNQDVVQEELVYYLMNKPRNVVSTTNDEKGRKTVIDLFLEEHKKERLYPVGRLDYNTAGALIITNDGDLSYILTRPEYEVPKTYLVRVKGFVSRKTIQTLARGVVLEDYKTKPARVKLIEVDSKKQTSLVEITLTEGKNHQVKNMFKQVGHDVTSLTRTHFDFLSIEGLSRGHYRKLKIHEVKRLYSNNKLVKSL